LFGYFAGLTYWFPKLFGFMLNEKWGKRAFWGWFIGFILAFGPLYLLGFMGATRRLDHYADLGWQPLFIVAAIGAACIALGVVFQVVQVIVSIRDRTLNRDTTGDPWGGRTLEWMLPSPPPEYNFATIPTVAERDQFLVWKETGKQPKVVYEDIVLPKNSGAGVVVGVFAFLCGFGIVWHLWWLAGLGVLGALVVVILRTFNEDTERVVSKAEVEQIEKKLRRV
jgi:cytochrome o ubiquinol oxidase subunit 1